MLDGLQQIEDFDPWRSENEQDRALELETILRDLREETGSPWLLQPLDRTVWESAEIRAALEELVAPLRGEIDRWEEIASRDALGLPPVDRFSDPDEAHLAGTLGRSLSNASLLLRVNGEISHAARQQAIHADLSGRFLRESPNWVWIVLAASQRAKALEAMGSLLFDGELDAALHDRLLREPSIYEADPDLLARGLRREYQVTANELRIMARGQHEELSRLEGWALKENRGRRVLAERFRELIVRAQLPPHARPPSTHPGVPELYGSFWRGKHSDYLALLVTSAHDFARCDEWQLQERCFRVLLAFRSYEKRAGGVPVNWEDLIAIVPELGGIPEDPFSGQPLRYDSVREIFWSVGPDFSDDGATVWDTDRTAALRDRFEQNDWIWPVPRLPK